MTGEQILKTYTTKSRKAAMLSHEQPNQQTHLHEPSPTSQPADGERQKCDQSDGTRLSKNNPEDNNLKKHKDCEHQAIPATNKRQDFPPKPQPRASQMDNQHHHQQQQQQNQSQPAVVPSTGTPVVRTGTFTRGQLKQQDTGNNYKLNGGAGGQKVDQGDFSIQFKTGFLNRKRILDAKGKPTSRGHRGWRRIYVILRDLRFVMRDGNQHKDQENDRQPNEEQQQQPSSTVDKQNKKQQLAAKDLKNAIKLHHAFAKKSSSYTKREYVFHLQLADQSELLLQADSEEEMNSWINTINFASACLSSPPLPNSVTNSGKRYLRSSTRYYRPKLPASYTKLPYWEQLTDHEERLERLKTELEELLNEASVKRHADKHSKSDFIDKIAYLRQKIEHYTVYLDLMQRKSNSHEAIILSKHPQIASLTPSREMVQSLPLYAKAHEDCEDKKDAN